MSISALPTPPDRSDPATFSSRADAFLGALPTFATEANALATQANRDAAVAAAAAIGTVAASGTSTDSLTIGTGSKSITTQTGKAITAGMSMKWAMQSDAAKYMTGTVTSYDAGTGALVMNMTATNGSGTSSAWEGVVTAAATGNTITRRAITGADTVGVSDIAKLIDITSGTFTLAFTACATLGNGAWGYIRNSGTGDVTLDPDGSEQIDGLTSFVMYPGEVRLWQCDGSEIRTIVLKAFSHKFTATAVITRPPGYAGFDVECLGAGGGGYAGGVYNVNQNAYGGCGGGGGAYVTRFVKFSDCGATETITIGAGGAGGVGGTGLTVVGAAGAAGGNTSFGSHVVAYGGGVATQGGGGGGMLSAGSGSEGGLPLENTPGTYDYWRILGGGTGEFHNSLGGNSVYGGGAGGGLNGSNIAANAGCSWMGGAGGGAGGTVDGANTSHPPTAGSASKATTRATGGAAGASSATNAGTAGTAGTTIAGWLAGTGGGGGGANQTASGKNGGAGSYGCGGGGGGGTRNGYTAGSGGAGGDGACLLVGVV